jgi:hypothetical protein
MRTALVAALIVRASCQDNAAVVCRPGECYSVNLNEHAQQCSTDVHCEAPAACNINARRCQFEPIPSERVIRWAALIGGACAAAVVLILGVTSAEPVSPPNTTTMVKAIH